MPIDHQEVEWQFDIVDANINDVEQWLLSQSTGGAIGIHPDTTKQQVDIYFDTNDWRFYRAGYALRVRRNGAHAEATLKAVTSSQKGPRERREITETIEEAQTDSSPGDLLRRAQGAVGERVRAVAGARVSHLRPLFETHTTRHVLDLRVSDVTAGEIALDETTIPAGARGKDVQLRRVEVEITSDGAPPKEVKAFVKHMRKACDLQRAKTSKYEAGLAARGLQPLQDLDLGPTDPGKRQSVGDLTFAVMRETFAAMWSHDPGARLGDDTGAIHDMRVAVRRLRAAMGLYKDYLPEQIEPMREELGWIGDALGKVRDLDVQIEQVDAWREEVTARAAVVPGPERAGYQAVVAILTEQRQKAHAALLDVLNSRRYERFVAGFTALLRTPPEEPDLAATLVTDVAPELVEQHYRKMRKLGDALGPESLQVDYHQVRIKAKGLRYGLEFICYLYGKPVQSMLAHIVELQDTLGMYHDSQIAMEQFRAMGADPNLAPSPQVVFALGEIAQRYGQLGEEMKDQFPTIYARLKGRRWKALKDELESRAHRHLPT